MTTPHKWADVIKAWADGKSIQVRIVGGEWLNYFRQGIMSPAFNNPATEWRVKPNTIRYRCYVAVEETDLFYVDTYNQSLECDIKVFEKSDNFVRWIDTEWQEVEV